MGCIQYIIDHPCDPSPPSSRTLSHAQALSRRLSFTQSTAWDTVTAGIGSHCPRAHSYHHYALHADKSNAPLANLDEFQFASSRELGTPGYPLRQRAVYDGADVTAMDRSEEGWKVTGVGDVDGRLLAVGDDFGRLKVYEWTSHDSSEKGPGDKTNTTSTNQELACLAGHVAHIHSVKWVPGSIVIGTGAHGEDGESKGGLMDDNDDDDDELMSPRGSPVATPTNQSLVASANLGETNVLLLDVQRQRRWLLTQGWTTLKKI